MKVYHRSDTRRGQVKTSDASLKIRITGAGAEREEKSNYSYSTELDGIRLWTSQSISSSPSQGLTEL